MNEVIDMEQPATPVASTTTTAMTVTNPAELLALAVSRGANIDQLERLMALQERWEANEARKAFVQAMADFKSEPLEIFKRKQVGYKTKEGDFVGYSHAELSDVADVVVPAMARHGLTHRWAVQQADGRVIVTCEVTHRAGHRESVTMDAAPDNSGKKNAIQQVASAITYMQRYTLLAACGLATKADNPDDDGAGAGSAESGPLAGLLDDLKETTTDAAALAFWHAHRGQLTTDKRAYDTFKNAVVAHRKSLEK